MAGRKWTNEEIELLKKNYNKTAKELTKIINRSLIAIDTKKRKIIGVKNKLWSKLEIEYLKNNTDKTSKEIAMHLGRTAYAVECQRKINKIKSNCWHNFSKTKLYHVWRSLRERCRSPKHKDYHRYGGRGITVCDEWQNSVVPFMDWALNNGYKEGLSIDRIDNDGNYCPENCRWATIKEQNNNTSRNKKKV